MQKVGVYSGMFDQSLLNGQRTNKTWTTAVSVVGQLVFVAALCLIPLVYTDQLQGFAKWSQRLVLPTPPPMVREPVVQIASAPVRAADKVFRVPPSIPKGVAEVHDPPSSLNITAPAGPVVIGDPLAGGIDLANTLSHLLPVLKPPPPAPPPVTAVPPKASAPVRVTSSIQEAKLLRKVVPLYPPIAITARVQGTVQLVGVIAKDGTIRDLQVVQGNPLLVRAAVDAVEQWLYKPTILNGEAVEVIAPINVTFVLGR